MQNISEPLKHIISHYEGLAERVHNSIQNSLNALCISNCCLSDQNKTFFYIPTGSGVAKK